MGGSWIDVQLGRNAKSLERHEQLFRLWPRYARVSFDDVDHRRSLCIPDVLERRLIPVGVEVVVRQLVSQIELPIPLHIAFSVHRDPVRRAGASTDRLEAISVGQNPVRPVTAGAPAEYSHFVAVDNTPRDQVVDTGHNVFVTLLEIVADDVS